LRTEQILDRTGKILEFRVVNFVAKRLAVGFGFCSLGYNLSIVRFDDDDDDGDDDEYRSVWYMQLQQIH